ncbi:serine hydrolase [uncultured Roseobacter sp.]|uniref:serine hydrolase n=1 Tax=uncultured Roseobacter sp. TaxID=114847 RepID=UPI0034587D79
MPRAAVAIFRRSAVLFLKGFGADGRGVFADDDTIFSVGSISKAVTARVAMRSKEAGRLTLETSVGASIPELRNTDAAG